MLQNISFHDYVLNPDGLFIFTGAMWVPSSAHIMRKGYTHDSDSINNRIGARFNYSTNPISSASITSSGNLRGTNKDNDNANGISNNKSSSVDVDSSSNVIFYYDDDNIYDDSNSNDTRSFTPYSQCFDISNDTSTHFEFPFTMIDHIANACIYDGSPYGNIITKTIITIFFIN